MTAGGPWFNREAWAMAFYLKSHNHTSSLLPQVTLTWAHTVLSPQTQGLPPLTQFSVGCSGFSSLILGSLLLLMTLARVLPWECWVAVVLTSDTRQSHLWGWLQCNLSPTGVGGWLAGEGPENAFLTNPHCLAALERGMQL